MVTTSEGFRPSCARHLSEPTRAGTSSSPDSTRANLPAEQQLRPIRQNQGRAHCVRRPAPFTRGTLRQPQRIRRHRESGGREGRCGALPAPRGCRPSDCRGHGERRPCGEEIRTTIPHQSDNDSAVTSTEWSVRQDRGKIRRKTRISIHVDCEPPGSKDGIRGLQSGNGRGCGGRRYRRPEANPPSLGASYESRVIRPKLPKTGLNR